MKKLIYILNSYSRSSSSHFYHILGLVENIAKRDVKVVLIIEKAEDEPEFSDVSVEVICLRRRFFLFRYLELYLLLVNLIRKGYWKTFVRISSMSAIIAAVAHRMFGGESFLWQSGTTLEYDLSRPFGFSKIKWYIGSYSLSKLARYSVHYFVTGPSAMVKYYSDVAGVSPDKIKLLFNDVEINRFSPPSDRFVIKQTFLERNGFSSESLVLLLVHRLSPVRRTQLYFPFCLRGLFDDEVAGNVVVLIAGSGPELSPIRTEIEDMGLAEHCLFLGNVPNAEIQQLYSMADIFLHPTYNEGFPRVILEAMAAELPIVSTDAGGTRELMGELQAKCVVSRDDPSAFAECLRRFVADPELRQRLAVENKTQVKQFSTEKVAAMYDEVLFS